MSGLPCSVGGVGQLDIYMHQFKLHECTRMCITHQWTLHAGLAMGYPHA